MASVKTAISVGASTLARIDALAREMKVPRSRLFALAAEEFLDRHDARSVRAAIDRAYAEAPTAAEKRWLRSTRRKHRQLIEGEW
ncbi:MAG: ribbon-helix-helix protein, CopG family [Acidobacteria bacterium]|nr:ribbon-helix-helix protein, CopG family [Acidobacteriota bacterium]